MLTRTAVERERHDVGFDVDRLLAVHFSVPTSGFDERVFVRAALAAVRELPGVLRNCLRDRSHSIRSTPRSSAARWRR